MRAGWILKAAGYEQHKAVIQLEAVILRPFHLGDYYTDKMNFSKSLDSYTLF